MRLLTDPYRLSVAGDIEPEYARKVLVETPGFSQEAVSAFRYSESGGRRLDETRPLYWGRGYYLLWHSSLRLPWPQSIWREPLRDVGPWCAGRIELPAHEDEAMVTWADRYLARDVQRPPLTLSLVHPATALRLDDDSLVIDDGEDILVGITGEHGSEIPDTLHISSQSGIGHNSLALPNRLPLLIEVTGFSSGITRLSLDDEEDTELVLEFKRPPGVQTFAGPAIHVLEDNVEYDVPIYSEAAEEALGKIRAGRMTLTGVNLEPLRGVRLRTRARSTRTWSEAVFACNPNEGMSQSDQQRDMQQGVLAAIQEASLKLQALDLDCGNHGRIVLSEVAIATATRRAVRLTQALRGRIRWVLQMVAHGHQGLSVVPDPVLPITIVSLLMYDYPEPSDRELLTLLGRSAHWPPTLFAHVRDLARQLQHLQSTES